MIEPWRVIQIPSFILFFMMAHVRCVIGPSEWFFNTNHLTRYYFHHFNRLRRIASFPVSITPMMAHWILSFIWHCTYMTERQTLWLIHRPSSPFFVTCVGHFAGLRLFNGSPDPSGIGCMDLFLACGIVYLAGRYCVPFQILNGQIAWYPWPTSTSGSRRSLSLIQTRGDK